MSPPVVDLVYTWVDGSWPEHQGLLRRYARSRTDLNPERFRDHLSLLRYSLRSVERFAPWVGNIVLVTHRPQVPAWLRTSHPRVRLVHHDEIFEPGALLPTFNSRAIESFLHRVPTSSDYYLYFNDDWFFGSLSAMEDFRAPDGRLRLMGTTHSRSLLDRLRNVFVRPGWIEHAPYVIYKPYWEVMQRPFAAEIERTRRNRFRSPDDLRMPPIYRRFLLSLPAERREVVPAHRVVHLHRLHRITNDLAWQARELERVWRMRPRYYCLNDDQGEHPDPRVVDLVQRFLERYYPEPSQFEIA